MMSQSRLETAVLVLLLLGLGCERAADTAGDEISPPEPTTEVTPPPAAAAPPPESVAEPEVAPTDPGIQALAPGEPAEPNIPDFVAARPIEDPASVEPGLGLVEGFHRLILPTSASEALRQADPDFEAWTLGHYWSYIFDTKAYDFDPAQAMFAVVGDFNGDGKADALADGRSGESLVTVALVSTEVGYQFHELFRRDSAGRELTWSGGSRFFVKAEPRRYTESGASGDRTVELTTDGVIEVFFERASVLHYFRGGRWHELILSD